MRPSAAGPNKISMVGYRRQKYLVIWGLAILVLIVLFYYFASDGKTVAPLKNFTLILATTTSSSKEEAGNWLKPYNSAVQFDSVSIM